ncbi:MAG: type II toxin-antitoxin system HicB family antitoxin [Bryobacteraceae bacterium]
MKPFRSIGTPYFLSPPAEGGFIITCPALPGLVTEGDRSKGFAPCRRMRFAFTFESLRKDNLPIPSDMQSFWEEILVLIPESA